MRFVTLLVLLLGIALSARAQSYSDEDTNWGIAPTSELATNSYHSKTPITVPGAKTVKTVELKAMLEKSDPPVLFDVLGGKDRVIIPGAILLGFDAGDGRVFGAEKARFAKMLANITSGNKDKSMVFYCLSSKCWLSYNASLRAVGEGYKDVMWYRGGIDAWKAAGYYLVGGNPYKW